LQESVVYLWRIMTIIGIIPARYDSVRFPGKPLALINGIPMIQRVYTQTKKVKRLDEVLVATDDQRIYELVQGFGGKVIMTSAQHQNGTERCAEVASHFPNADFIINVQGDEPFISPLQIELLIDQLQLQKTGIATLAKQLTEEEDWLDPNIVKVLFDKHKRVLYFSRAALPFHRQHQNKHWNSQQKYYKHIGLYGYDRKSLLEISQLAASPLELAESLEQLRWLENGYPIGIAVTEEESLSVDHPDDIERAEEWMRRFLG
jgi:3-deoxy-manno-octulosonate cytidylyltransferase (CMP-KDO synthetase)